MNKIVIAISILLLAGCGPSESKMLENAKAACSVIENSRKLESSMRVKLVQEVREKNGLSFCRLSDFLILLKVERNECLELFMKELPFTVECN